MPLLGSWERRRANGFGCCIDAFTIKAVAQDDFSDVQIPDAPAQAAHTPNVGVNRAVDEATLKR